MSKQRNWHERSFFGLHYDLHANEQDTELGKEAVAAHLRKELAKVKPDFVQCDCKGHPGYAGYPTKIGTPARGIRRDALKVMRRVTRKMGIPLSIHYSGVMDDLAGKKHPSWQVQLPDGARVAGKMCTNGPYLQKLLIPQFMEVIEQYDIDGIWVDGDSWAAAACWCKRCRRLFREKHGHDAPENPEDAHWVEWLRFHRTSFERYVTRYVQAVHDRKPTCLVCSNWSYTARMPGPIDVPVDWLSGDAPPQFALERLSLEARYLTNRGHTWDLMLWTFHFADPSRRDERSTKTFPHLAQEAAGVIMHGGSLFLYDQPTRSGRLIPWHHDIFAKVARFVRRRRAICKDTQSVPQIALLHSERHYYAHNKQLFNFGEEAPKALFGALACLIENHYHFDFLDEQMLVQRMAEFPVVIVPEQSEISKALCRSLMDYVREGGRLLVVGNDAARNFGPILGVRRRGAPRKGLFYVQSGKEADCVPGSWQFVRPTTARSLAPLLSGPESDRDSAGAPAATLNNVGRGYAAAIHGPVFSAYSALRYPRIRDFVGAVLDKVAGPQIVSLDAPRSVEFALRRKQDRLIIHLLNRSTPPALAPNHDTDGSIPSVGPIRIRVKCPKRPTRVYLAPDPKGLRWE